MTASHTEDAEREQRLDEAVAEYLHAEGQGAPPDQAEFLARYPDLAPKLADYFKNREHFDRCAAPLRAGAEEDEFPRPGPRSGGGTTRSQANRSAGGGTTLDEVSPRPTSGPAAALTGPRTIGKFELLSVLGEGTFGTVYKARDTLLGRIVALKVPRRDRLPTEQDLERFLREGRHASRLSHPAIVPVYETGQADGEHYLVQAFVPGPTLAQVLRERQLTPHEAARMLATVADALQAAHEQRVFHRDVKPSNILLGPGDTPYLTDFGLALNEAEAAITADGRVLGTINYMSPEQARGQSHRVDGRADVYSLGVILYLLLTHELPFRGSKSMVLLQVLYDEPRPPRSLNDFVPRDLETICLRALAKSPGRRYASARDFAEDLRRFLAGQPIQARPVGPAERLGLWCRRNPALAAATSLTLAALLALSGVLAGWAVRERGHAQALAQALAENYLDHGRVLCEGGDPGAGLLWLARSLEKAPATADRLQHTIRAQFAGWSRHVLPLRTAFDHPGPIRAAALSPDGGTVWTAGEDKVLYRWNVKDEAGCQLLGSSRPLAAPVKLIAWRPDGAIVLTVDAAGAAQRWDAATGERWGEPLQQKKVLAAAWSPEGKTLVTGGADGSVWLWDAATGRPRGTGFRQEGAVRNLAVGPDSRTILTATWPDGAVTTSGRGASWLWDTATGEYRGQRRQPLPHGGVVWAAAFSPDGRTVVTSSVDTLLTQRWDVWTCRPLGSPVRHKNAILALAFSPDGQTLLAGGNDRSARLYDTSTGQTVGQPLAHRAAVRCVAFSADGRTVLTAGADGAVRLWDAVPDRLFGLPLRHGDQVQAAVFSPDGRAVLTACRDKAARLWDAATGKLLGTLPHPEQVQAADFSPDGRLALTVCMLDTTVRLWDVASRQLIGPPLDHGPDRATMAVFSPDGRTVLTGASDGSVRFWDTATGALRSYSRRAHPLPVMAVVFSPDGRAACTGGGDTARLWDAATGNLLGPPLAHNGTVWATAFSPDSRTLLTGGDDGTARLWDAATGNLLGPVLPHGDFVTAVAFSPDGRTILTASEDGTARLWDAATRAPVGRLLAHHGRVVAVAFSPDGRTALTGSWDGTARLWDVATGKPLGPPLVHDGRVWAATFSPDGRTVLTGSNDRTARLWPMPAPAVGATEQIALQAEVLTGLELDAHDVTHVLDAERWRDRRLRLRELAATQPP